MKDLFGEEIEKEIVLYGEGDLYNLEMTDFIKKEFIKDKKEFKSIQSYDLISKLYKDYKVKVYFNYNTNFIEIMKISRKD